jgi:hypothetical protein
MGLPKADINEILSWLEITWGYAYNQGVADDQTAADMNYEHSPARANPFNGE